MPIAWNLMPKATKNLLVVNCLVFLAQYLFGMRGVDLTDLFGLHFVLASGFKVWQPITYMFLHGNLTHLFFNMFALWMFGVEIERTLGLKRFLIFYFVCGIGAAFCQELWQLVQYSANGLAGYTTVRFDGGEVVQMADFLNQWTTVGASGACYGILLAFGVLYPNEVIMLIFPPIPMKAKYFVFIYAALELLFAFTANDNIAHFAHIGGMLFGWGLLVYWRRQQRRPKYGNYVRYKEVSERETFFSRLKHWLRPNDTLEVRRNSKAEQANRQADDLRQQMERQQRVDEILDKIKLSGYDSLTPEEKDELFRNSSD